MSHTRYTVMRSSLILICLFVLPLSQLAAQQVATEKLYAGMAGYWYGTVEERSATGDTTVVPVALDIRPSFDGSTLFLHTSMLREDLIVERSEQRVYMGDSVQFRISGATDASTYDRRYTVQGMQKLSSAANFVLRLSSREGPPYVRMTDIRQNDSLIVVTEESQQRDEWEVRSILRVALREAPAPVILFLPGQNDARDVCVVASFNGWVPGRTTLRRARGGWQVTLQLPPGEYQYKFRVDGRQVRSPLVSSIIADGKGGYNAILVVR